MKMEEWGCSQKLQPPTVPQGVITHKILISVPMTVKTSNLICPDTDYSVQLLLPTEGKTTLMQFWGFSGQMTLRAIPVVA
jgi:hypothetical protein